MAAPCGSKGAVRCDIRRIRREPMVPGKLWKGRLAMTEDSGRTALLAIDIQIGMFASPLIPPVHNGEALLSKVAGLILRARTLRLPVIFVQHCGGKGHPLAEGTQQVEIHPAVAPERHELVIKKRHCDSFQNTSLDIELRSRDVTSLIIAGIATEFCVDTATRRAFSLGYKVSLVQDAHSTWDAAGLKAEQIIAHHNRLLGALFAELVSSDSAFGKAASSRTS
jgi:nicotinamidase-related amidase